MTVADGGDRQNREGFEFLRSRFIRRASVISMTHEFRSDISMFCRSWNVSAPRYQIVPVAAVGDLEKSPRIDRALNFYSPNPLREDAQEYTEQDRTLSEFVEALEALCDKYWPPHLYTVRMESAFRPSLKFVSACLFCSPFEVGNAAELFFSEFKVRVWSYPEKPDVYDKLTIEHLQGQVDFLTRALESHLAGIRTPQEIDDLIGQSIVAGARRGRDSGWAMDPEKRWYFIPMVPGMSTTDIREATGGIVDLMRRVYGDRRIDEMIYDLRDQGMSQQGIADLLGVSRDTVIQALNYRPQGDESEK